MWYASKYKLFYTRMLKKKKKKSIISTLMWNRGKTPIIGYVMSFLRANFSLVLPF